MRPVSRGFTIPARPTPRILPPVVLVLLAGALIAGPASARQRVLHGAHSRAYTVSGRPRSGRVVPRRWILDPPSSRQQSHGPAARRFRARSKASRPGATSRRPLLRARGAAPGADIFSGLSADGLGATSFGPELAAAVSPDHYVEAVDHTVAVYDPSDLHETASGPLADLAGAPHDFAFAPQIQWDAQARRWLYTFVDEGATTDDIAFGWSKTADPSALADGWCHFFIPAVNDTPDGFTFEDAPKLGHDDGHIIISTDLFTQVDSATARVRAVAKPSPGDESCDAPDITTFGTPAEPLVTEHGEVAGGLVPADTTDASANGYVVAAASASLGASPDHLTAWHVSGSPSAPTLTLDGDLDVAAYGDPEPVDQPGKPGAIFLPSAQLGQAVAHADPDASGAEAVWTQHTVAGGDGRAEIRWYELLPAADDVRQHGGVADPQNAVFGGAISPALDGSSAALQYIVAGSELLPEIRARSRASATPAGVMAAETVVGESSGTGACSYGCAWPTYVPAAPDPAHDTIVWGSNLLGGPLVVEDEADWRSRNFALDTTPRADSSPPETTIDSAPSGEGNGTTATVTFSSDDPDATFECQVDHEGWSPCDSPLELQDLHDGPITVDVRATDAAGNTDTTPATATWFVGFPPPNDDFADAEVITATAGPVTVIGSNVNATSEIGEPLHFFYLAQGHSIWYAWTAAASGTVSVDACSDDFLGVVDAYQGSALGALTNVAGGGVFGCPNTSFTFQAQAGVTYHVAVDGADLGEDEETGDVRLTITPPTPPETSITVGPPAGSATNDSTPSFAFSSSEAGSTFQCRVDAAAFAACTSPRTVGPLADGTHTFAVRARDTEGSVDATPASRTFTVDTRAPSVTITGGPADHAVIASRRATFRFQANESGAELRCRVDDGAFAPCASPHTTARLGDGSHTFAVRATDAAGNTGTPATRSLRVRPTAGRVHRAVRRLKSGRVRIKRGRRLVLPTLAAGALPKGTKVGLSLRAHGHLLGKARTVTGRKRTRLAVSLNHRGRRLVRSLHGAKLHAKLAIAIRAKGLKAAKATRTLRVRT